MQVLWCMDVICHGLSLPLHDHETIRDCVNVYCDWLTSLMPNPRITVPKPICDDANIYARKIINHFHNLFVPRPGEGEPTRPKTFQLFRLVNYLVFVSCVVFKLMI